MWQQRIVHTPVWDQLNLLKIKFVSFLVWLWEPDLCIYFFLFSNNFFSSNVLIFFPFVNSLNLENALKYGNSE